MLNHGAGPLIIAAYDASGNVLWAKQTGGAAGSGSVTAISTDHSGNIYITGYFTSATLSFGSITLNMTASSVNHDGFIAKFDSLGNALWAKDISCANSATATSVCTDTAGNVAITGYYYTSVSFGTTTLTETGAGNAAFIAKYNSTGSLVWARTANSNTEAEAFGIASDQSGNFFITGYYWGSVVFGTVTLSTTYFQNTVFVAKYNAAGAAQWARGAGGTTANDFGSAVAADASGNVYVTGTLQSATMTFGATVLHNAGSTDIFLAKYSSTGAIQWAKQAGGTDVDNGNALVTDASGSVYLSGNYSSSSLAFGSVSLLSPGGGTAFFVTKFDGSGTAQWAKSDYVSNTNYATGVGIAVNSCSDVYVTGLFNGTLTMLPTPGVVASSENMYVSKIGDLTGSSVKASCTGINNGMAIVKPVTPGTAPYTYTWTGGASTDTATGLSSGIYTVTVTDARGCSNRELVTVTNRSNITSSFTSGGVNCSGPCTGTETALAANGVPPYTYLWDSTTGSQTTAMALNVCPTVYTITITDSLGCVKTFAARVVPNTVVAPHVSINNLSSVDLLTLDPAFATYYTYDIPTSITADSTNPYNLLNPGRIVRLKMKVLNQKVDGTAIPAGQCVVHTNSPYISVIDSISSFSNINYGASSWPDDEIAFHINDSTPPGANIYFDMVVIDNTNEYFNACICVPVMPLVMASEKDTTVNDNNTGNSVGNGNDICETGETIEFKPLVNNVAGMNALYVRSELMNMNGVPGISIWNHHAGISGNVSDTAWWGNGTLNVYNGYTNVRPHSDFVFDYTNPATIHNFYLYNLFTSGFKLLPASPTTISAFRWAAPFEFNKSPVKTQEVIAANEINIYPNPSAGSFTISLPEQMNKASITVIDITGKTLLRNAYTTSTINLELNNVPPGVYFVRITDEISKESTVRKITIIK